MKIITGVTALILRLAAALILTLFASVGSAQQVQTLVFNHVRLFDGESDLAEKTVIVRDGKIAEIADVPYTPSDDARVVDGKGMTLMPGLIDCHVHTFFRLQLIQAAQFGVTTECDMMSNARMTQYLRDEQKEEGHDANDRSDFYSAGAAVTVKGGHGTQFGFPVPMLDSPENAEAFIKARIQEGSDYIKIIYDDGKAFGISFKSLTPEMAAAAITATHEQGKIAVAHVSSRNAAEILLNAGIDGFVHLFADEEITDSMLKTMLEKKTFVVPTACVVSGVCGLPVGDLHTDDGQLKPFLTGTDIGSVNRRFPARPMPSSLETLRVNLKRLNDAGVPILAGTDAPNPGTTHGATMHVEMELLVDAGLTATQALAAATSLPAKHFGFADRGRIAKGLRADLVLVNGNPTEDIKATRDIVGVWKAGVEIDRDKLRDQVAKASKESEKSE